MINILIADDHAVLRAGLRLLLEAQADFHVIGEVGDVAAALTATIELKPDILLLDLSMPGGDTMSLIRHLAAPPHHQNIVVLTMHDDLAIFRRAVAAGALGYVLKSAADTELVSSIRAVASGQATMTVKNACAQTSATVTASGLSLANLSLREKEILVFLAQGHTNREIAERLLLSVKTVESYRSRLMKKLKVDSRAAITEFAIDCGLLSH